MMSACFALLLSLTMLVSCGGGDDDSSSAQQQEDGTTVGGSSGGSGPEIIFDNELTGRERQALEQSSNAMGNIDMNGSQIRRFTQIFGGSKSSDVVNYFEARVNYALSANTSLEERLVVAADASATHAIEGEIVALNPSSVLWFISKISEPEQDVQFLINERPVDITSSRIGVMQFGAVFADIRTLEQVRTLVHEARHSDCTGGVLASDLERFENRQPMVKHECGHSHVICPSGPLEGEFACDEHPWGAYAVDTIYSGAVALTCTNCSETEKQVAEAMTLDGISRLNYDFNELLDGEFGAPDMSSSTRVR